MLTVLCAVVVTVTLAAGPAPHAVAGQFCPGEDYDRDGYGQTCDCDDIDPTVYPLAPEVCYDNGLINNCWDQNWPYDWWHNERDDDRDGLTICAGDCNDSNGEVRPGLSEYCDSLDNDCDGRIDAPLTPDTDGDGYSPSCGDCSDGSATIFPDAPQVCGDGLNNDCRSSGWPALAGTNEADDDGDGFTECAGDCNDQSAAIHPGRLELCDGIDNDCDGRVDAPFPPGADSDGDGYSPSCGDCDDTSGSVFPGAPQLCGDSLNNDCNSLAWPEFEVINESDDDGDSLSECSGDCDDSNALVYPGAAQMCDGVNNDCLDTNWPQIPASELDLDNDGQMACAGDCSDYDWTTALGFLQVCDGRNNNCADPGWPVPPANETDADGDGSRLCSGDCDDTNASIRPGLQYCDGINNDCNDPAWPVPPANEADADGDSFQICRGDCLDTDARVYPGAAQVCDGVNNNCSQPGWPALAGTAEGDDDSDGVSECGGDCLDTDARVYPGAAQLCDGINTDCSDPSWPAVPSSEHDGDLDGSFLCSDPGDCNDSLVSAWAPPGPAIGPNFVDPLFLYWFPPANPGGTVVYDLLRTDNPISFLESTVCVRAGTPQTFWDEEVAEPALDHFFSYVVRVRNFCPAGQNLNMGTDSAGLPRVGRTCP